MNILFVFHYAGSAYHGMVFRPYYLGREWKKYGHNTTVVAASYTHLRQKNPEMTEDIMEEYIDGVRYIWLKTPKYSGNGIGRIKNMLAFVWQLFRYLPKIIKEFTPDAVILSSTYQFDVYPAYLAAKKCGAKFISEVRDLWPLTPMVYGNMSKWHPYIFAMQRAEDFWCKRADAVVSVLSHAYKHLVQRGMSMDKFHVIPNGVVLEDWKDKAKELPEEHTQCFTKLKSEGKFIVGYVGSIVFANHLEILLQAAQKAQKEKELHFVIVGKGSEKEQIVALAEKMQLRNVTMLPAVSKELIPELLSRIDVAVFFGEGTKLDEYGASKNKIYDYMMAARPVIWSATVPKDIVLESGCGYTVVPKDYESFIAKLSEIKNMSETDRNAMGERGRKYIIEHNSYAVLAKEYLDVLSR